MRDLVEFVAKSLVEDPVEVHVNERRRGNRVYLQLKVAKEDAGRVIGRGGRVANALRTLLRVPAARAGVQVYLDIL